MLFLITGQPGHRKSALGVQKLMEYANAGRQVYVQSEGEFRTQADKVGAGIAARAKARAVGGVPPL